MISATESVLIEKLFSEKFFIFLNSYLNSFLDTQIENHNPISTMNYLHHLKEYSDMPNINTKCENYIKKITPVELLRS